MKNWSIDNKLWLCVLAPTIISTLCLALLLTQSFFRQSDQDFFKRGNALTNYLGSRLASTSSEDQARLQSIISKEVQNQSSVLSLTFYDPNRKLVWQYGSPISNGPIALNDWLLIQPTIATAFHGDESSQFYQAIFDVNDGSLKGWINAEIDRRSLQLRKHRIVLKLALVTALGLVLAIFSFTILKRNIVRPLSYVRNDLEFLSYGDIDKLSDVKHGQPFDLLSNYMRRTGELIRSSRQELHDTVEQATSDLRQTLETVEVQNVELNLARKQALAANTAKSEFLSNTSHEIRTPINGILGFVQLLLKSNLNEQQQEYLRNIEKSSNGLLATINSIIDVSKIENGQLALDYNPFDLAEIVEDSIDIFKAAALEKNIDLKYIIASTIPRSLLGDGLRLKQVLCNLISNAIKFSSEGDVLVKVSKANLKSNIHSDLDQSHSTNERKIELLFTVEDHGKGIEPSERDGIFQLFSQLDGSNSREHGGSGLGLAVCKGLVELMRGKIGVDSQVGQGSTFWFRVNFVVNQNPMAASEIQSKSSSGQGKFTANILAVDDTPANLQLMGEFLKDLGANVSLANDGMEALAFCEKQTFDLIFMDIQMPTIDGLETTRRIRKLETPPNRMPIVALTAHAMTDQKSDLLLAGLDDYLSKPVSENQLLHVIKRWVKADENRQPASASEAELPKISPIPTTVKLDLDASSPVDLQLCLKLSNNKPDLARDMLTLLIKDLPSQREKIVEYRENKQIEELAEVVHKIRGGASYCGVAKLKQSSSVADELLRKQEVDDSSLDTLLAAIDELVTWSKEFDINVLFGFEPVEE